MKLMKTIICMCIVALCVSEAVAGSFTDSRDGKTYKTVEIGNRIWMAENLNYKTPNSKCYGNNASNCKTYGRLYDSEDVKDACPAGWRLPDVGDFLDLAKLLIRQRFSRKVFLFSREILQVLRKSKWVTS